MSAEMQCQKTKSVGRQSCSLRGEPGVDEVLGQADAGGGASDGDLPIRGALHRVGDLDLSPRHLPDLIDLGTLTADDAPDQIIWNGHLVGTSLGRGVHPSEALVAGGQRERALLHG